MKTNFTPGPWIIKEDTYGCKNIVGNVVFGDTSEEQEIFVCSDIGYTTGLADENQDLYNAKLISSAPDLLEALQGLLEFIPQPDPVTGDGMKIDALRKADVAISKAIGKQPNID